MSINRMETYFQNQSPRPFEPAGGRDAFVQCPSILLAGLSDGEVQRMQETYRCAFEQARADVQRRSQGNGRDSFSDGQGI